MGVHSGKFAVVNGVSTVQNWTITDTEALVRFLASNTSGGDARRRGVRSWTGNFNAYGVTPAYFPGAIMAFKGYTAPDNDVSGNGVCANGNAIIDSLVINWDWSTAAIIKHTINFSGHLGITWDVSTATDATDPDAPEVCGAKVEISLDDSTFEELENVVSAALTITAANQSYVNSSTDCDTGRKAGTLGFTLSLVLQDNAVYDVLPKGADVAVRLYYNATDFWLLRFAKVKEYTGITCDNETGAIIQATVNLEMNGNSVDYGEGEISQVIDSVATTYWPPA